MTTVKSHYIVICAAVLFSASASATAAQPQERALTRHRVMQQQLQDEMTLRLQQDMARSRPGLTSRDRQKLDELALRQRIEQQQLDQQQIIQLQQFPRDAVRARVREDSYAQERDLQLQRFRDEQQMLLQSMKPAPLQRVPQAATLDPP
jgi:hypothetical protein